MVLAAGYLLFGWEPGQWLDVVPSTRSQHRLLGVPPFRCPAPSIERPRGVKPHTSKQRPLVSRECNPALMQQMWEVYQNHLCQVQCWVACQMFFSIPHAVAADTVDSSSRHGMTAFWTANKQGSRWSLKSLILSFIFLRP